jgi:agmatine deiminase
MLGDQYSIPVYRPDLTAEGGNFFTNGQGICFTTEYLKLQNPGKTQAKLNGIFKDYFGCEQVHYLKQLEGNVIYHIDMFMHVVDENTILLGQYDKSESPQNYQILEDNYKYLTSLKTKDGKPFEVIRVPMPSVVNPNLPVGVVRTYMNMVIVNDVVMVPVYFQEPAKEAEALDIIEKTFGNKQIVGIASDQIAWAFGSIHCTTQTVPSGY